MARNSTYKSGSSEFGAAPDSLAGVDSGGRLRRVYEASRLIIEIVMGLAIVIPLAGHYIFGLLWLSKVSDLTLAAAILGVSIAFTGALVPCLILALSRRSAVIGMFEDATEIKRQVDRGVEHAVAIRQIDRASRGSG